jgi:hypothetical protein
MTTAEMLAFWALIVSAATLLTYLGQLTVLILVYRRVIKETDRNAEIHKQEIAKRIVRSFASSGRRTQKTDNWQRYRGICPLWTWR